ncbi:DUF2939 domain-containing protein [Luteimonas sp. TWI1416]|uniref:DUF2939 domain-containing protein n=1 Tax=unclassified Luteimonas TaxID=2629088 RepID=UPI0032083AF6
MKKLAWLSALIAALLLAYTAAGPFLTMHAIRDAVQREDSRALSRQVDFPALRQSLRLQLAEALVRRAGVDVQSSLLGALALQAASGTVGTGVDMMVTPVGLSALMRGRRLWDLSSGATPPVGGDRAPAGRCALALSLAIALHRDRARRVRTADRLRAHAQGPALAAVGYPVAAVGLPAWRLRSAGLAPAAVPLRVAAYRPEASVRPRRRSGEW